MSRFSNQGLHRAEALFDSAHPYAPDYLDQAPILVMWALPWVSFGDESGETFARLWVSTACESSGSLKSVLRAASFTAPMRQLAAKALQPSHGAIYRMLARVAPEVLGRVIPKTAKAQRAWLRALDAWVSKWRRKDFVPARFEEYFVWCVERFADGTATTVASGLADFQAVEPGFNTAWSLKRALEEMDNWHRSITLDSQLRGLPVGADDPIDLGAHPDTKDMVGYVFTALRTPRQIADEGSAMRHCVATYIRAVFNGNSHIVSIKREGRRLATLELTGPKSKPLWRVAQIRGPRNSPVSPVVESGAYLYAELLKETRPAA